MLAPCERTEGDQRIYANGSAGLRVDAQGVAVGVDAMLAPAVDTVTIIAPLVDGRGSIAPMHAIVKIPASARKPAERWGWDG